ncbi:spore coat protein [Tissierella praeacuta]|uniref:spore coat protein n=1 Tax=Tissierella praeacuta TaxID=43131 RepID=UPI00333F20A2
MQINLSQKERMILEDGKKQEDICVKKYQSFANQAKDPNLKQLLNKLASEEQHHYNIVSDLLQGKKPNLTHSNQSANSQQNTNANNSNNMSFNNPEDALLCSDLLATEKYVSGFYDTGIFESANKDVREALQHIQKEEQKHGEELFNYMHANGMYNVK